MSSIGFAGVSNARQGKRFELGVDDSAQNAVERIAATLLANPMIEDFTVRIG